MRRLRQYLFLATAALGLFSQRRLRAVRRRPQWSRHAPARRAALQRCGRRQAQETRRGIRQWRRASAGAQERRALPFREGALRRRALCGVQGQRRGLGQRRLHRRDREHRLHLRIQGRRAHQGARRRRCSNWVAAPRRRPTGRPTSTGWPSPTATTRCSPSSTFALPVVFPANTDRVSVTETLADVTIPRAGANVSGGNFEILVGFQVTPEMAAFNHDGKRFRANAGQTQPKVAAAKP